MNPLKSTAALLLLSLGLAGAQTAAPNPANITVTVGGKLDPEAQVLGQMMVLSLQNAGYRVTDRTRLGDTDVNRRALRAGEIDVYPEYTGNGVYFFPGRITAETARNPQALWNQVRNLDIQNGVVWLNPARANNTWALAMPRAQAERLSIRTFEDFSRAVRSGANIRVAGSPEFFNRPDSFPLFERAYGFSLSNAQKLVLAGATPVQTQQAAARGQNGVNAAMAYGTDGTIAALDLVVIEDTRNAQPIYQPAPVIRATKLREDPRIGQILNRVWASLDGRTLQGLNAQVAVEGRNPRDVAATYLRSRGLIR